MSSPPYLTDLSAWTETVFLLFIHLSQGHCQLAAVILSGLKSTVLSDMEVLVDAARKEQELYKALEQLTQNMGNGFDKCQGTMTRKRIKKERA